MDAAERLFAEHGIATVSDRNVAAAAQNTNNSAVAYYFGGRPGLLRAMVDRHLEALEAPRRELFAQSDSLLGDVKALVVPVTDSLAGLPQPTWRARFLGQAIHDPSTAQLLRDSAEQAPTAAEVFASLVSRLHALGTLDHDETAARVSLMTHVVVSACADIERRSHAHRRPARWSEAGRFLSDAIAGMLTGPVTPH
jgi:AcrR family transcriptional regulator